MMLTRFHDVDETILNLEQIIKLEFDHDRFQYEDYMLPYYKIIMYVTNKDKIELKYYDLNDYMKDKKFLKNSICEF